MTEQGEKKDGESSESTADRYQKQIKEGREAVEESLNALEYARRKLDRAMASLGEFGDAPFEDLER
jgi:hypothetical protein